MVNSNMTIEETEFTGERESDSYVLTLDPYGGYVIETDSNGTGGRFTTKPYVKNVEFGERVGELPTPKRPGYTFDGWFKTTSGFWTPSIGQPHNGQLQVTEDTVWNWERDMTFEAAWEPILCTVVWDPNDGSSQYVVKTDENIPYGSVLGGFDSIEIKPERTGYEFVGWFTHPTDGVQVNPYTNV